MRKSEHKLKTKNKDGINIIIAEIADTTPNYVAKIRRGERYNPTIALLIKEVPKEIEALITRMSEALAQKDVEMRQN